jgi:DNA repair/transcription protein MET18/MMS19
VLHVPAYNFNTRNVVFKIYQSFLLNRDTILSQLDNPATYISAVLGGIDEEKDPRNLLITYDLLYFMLREFASNLENKAQIELIKPFIDEIFDKISCYFPINFVPPINDKYQITPDILKEKLARCFLASPLLAQAAIPFVIDKFKAT